MYTMLYTRLDVTFALSVMSRFQIDQGERHRVKCILKYLRMTKDLFLAYRGEELKLLGYNDSSFQLDQDDSNSTFEFLFTLNTGAVSWKNSK